MNKYQKQAIVDMVKVTAVVLGAIAVIGIIVKMGMEANDLLGALGMAVMGYCIYQLFQIRASQLESEDKLTEMERRYK